MKDQINHFLDQLDRSERTIGTYRWALSYFVKIVGDAELDMETYEAFLPDLRNHSPSTKRVLMSAIDGLYSFHECGDPQRMKKLKNFYIKKTGSRIINPDRDAIERVIKHCEGLQADLLDLRDRAFVLMLADSGFRISELTKVKRGDIDWKNERVVIVGKRDKQAVIRLSRRSLDALKAYLQARSEMDGNTGKPLGSLPLFAQHGNISTTKAMTPDGMRKAVKGRIKQAGIDPLAVRIHDFRHYFVTMIVLATDGNLKLAQELARHDSSTTTQGYAHLSETEKDMAYDEIFN